MYVSISELGEYQRSEEQGPSMANGQMLFWRLTGAHINQMKQPIKLTDVSKVFYTTHSNTWMRLKIDDQSKKK